MKCRAREIQYREALHAAYHDMAEIFLSFLDVSAGCIVSEKCGFKKKRLQHLFDITNAALTDCMQRMAADGEEAEETAETALWKMVRDLKYHGFNFYDEKEAHAFVDPFFNTWHSEREIHKHESRAEFVSRMDTATDLYYVTLLNYMHDERGYGAMRLRELYADLREDLNKFLAAYVGRCDLKGDEEAQIMLEERQQRVIALGLVLIDPDGDEIEPIRQPEPKVNIPLTVDEFIAAFGKKRYDDEMELRERELREREMYGF